MKRDVKLATRLIHSGQVKTWNERTRAVPIFQTGSYIFENADRAAKAFNLEVEDHLYGRLSNPTAEVVEKRLADMDGGKKAVTFASGMAALTNTILNIVRQGDTIVSSNALYGGTIVFFEHILKDYGINVKFVDIKDLQGIEKTIELHNAKLFFAETISNPKNNIPDFNGIAKICKKYEIPFVLDNTLTPVIFNPALYGIDIVIYSLSKYISGHGVVIGGAVVDMGKFSWKNPKYPYYYNPDPGYNNMIFGDQTTPFTDRLRGHMMKNFGAPLRPFDAFLTLIGMETLELRMERICSTAHILATRLQETEGVVWVNYPGVGLGEKERENLHYFNGQGGGIVCFGLGSAERSKKFADNLKLITHMANMGDAKTLIQHCASTSHSQLSEKELIESGTLPDLLRLSCGLEDVEDLWEDILSALKNC